MEALVGRLERAVVRLEAVAVKLQSCPGGLINGDISAVINGGESQSMEAFDRLLSGSVSEYVQSSAAIGGDVAKHAEMVNNALQVQRTLLKMAMTHQEPAKILQDFTLLFGSETASRLLERWPTVFKSKIIKLAETLTSTPLLKRLLSSAKQNKESSEAEDFPEWDSDISSFLLLLHFLSPQVSGRKKIQKMSISQAIDHLVVFQKTELADLLRPLSDQIQAVQNFREKNRGSSLFNHLSAVSESIPALGWVAVCQKPGPYVKEMNDAAMFYTNRVLKDFKDTDARHVEWVRSYLSIWTDLQTFIREHHCTGLIWSKTGPVAPPSLLSAPLLPPPPPPPPPMMIDSCSSPADAPSVQHAALFAQLNQGEEITKGLKHVCDEQKTHKNPNLRSQSGKTHHDSPSKTQSSSSSNPARKHPPVLELEGKKWRVEYQDQCAELLIEDTELRQVVYVFSCSGSTLQVKGKVNSIIVDNCKKLGLVFDNVVGIVEIINSRDIQLQVMGKVPTISINKTEGCHVYLSKDSLDCEIVSAKSSEMNILVPEGEDDYREFPVPEQFKTVWDGSSLVTEPTKIAG